MRCLLGINPFENKMVHRKNWTCAAGLRTLWAAQKGTLVRGCFKGYPTLDPFLSLLYPMARGRPPRKDRDPRRDSSGTPNRADPLETVRGLENMSTLGGGSEQYDGILTMLKEFINSRGHEEMTGGPGRGSQSLAEPMTAWLRGQLRFLYRPRGQVDLCPMPCTPLEAHTEGLRREVRPRVRNLGEQGGGGGWEKKKPERADLMS